MLRAALFTFALTCVTADKVKISSACMQRFVSLGDIKANAFISLKGQCDSLDSEDSALAFELFDKVTRALTLKMQVELLEYEMRRLKYDLKSNFGPMAGLATKKRELLSDLNQVLKDRGMIESRLFKSGESKVSDGISPPDSTQDHSDASLIMRTITDNERLAIEELDGFELCLTDDLSKHSPQTVVAFLSNWSF